MKNRIALLSDEIRPSDSRPLKTLFLPPSSNLFVVTAQQNIRDRPSAEFAWTGVLRFLEKAIPSEGLGDRGLGIANDPWQKSRNAFDDRRRCHLTAEEDKVTERNLLVDEVVDNALIDAFVAAAHQGEFVKRCKSVEMVPGSAVSQTASTESCE